MQSITRRSRSVFPIVRPAPDNAEQRARPARFVLNTYFKRLNNAIMKNAMIIVFLFPHFFVITGIRNISKKPATAIKFTKDKALRSPKTYLK